MGVFDVGPLEVLVILVIALLIFGPNKLPEFARNLGKAVNKFKSALSQSTSEVKREAEDITEEVRNFEVEVRKARSDLSGGFQEIGNEEGRTRPSGLHDAQTQEEWRSEHNNLR